MAKNMELLKYVGRVYRMETQKYALTKAIQMIDAQINNAEYRINRLVNEAGERYEEKQEGESIGIILRYGIWGILTGFYVGGMLGFVADGLGGDLLTLLGFVADGLGGGLLTLLL